jgi:hypothetical protein
MAILQPCSVHFLHSAKKVCGYYLRIMVIPFTAWGKKRKSGLLFCVYNKSIAIVTPVTSQMAHQGPEAVSKGEGQLSLGRWAQTCEAKLGQCCDITKTQGASLLQRKEKKRGAGPGKQLPKPQSEPRPHF